MDGGPRPSRSSAFNEVTSALTSDVLRSMRSAILTPSRKLLSAVVGALLAFSAASIEPLVARHEALADARSDEIDVGTELQAMEDIQLSRAEIAKGSKVSVTKILVRQGDLSSVDLALADGQVVKKVAIGTIRTYFRVLGS